MAWSFYGKSLERDGYKDKHNTALFIFCTGNFYFPIDLLLSLVPTVNDFRLDRKMCLIFMVVCMAGLHSTVTISTDNLTFTVR